MFKPVDKLTMKKFRAKSSDGVNLFVRIDDVPSEEKEKYKDLDNLRTYISQKFHILPVMTRSYLSGSEKENFSLCIHGRYFNSVEDKHPLFNYLSSYPNLDITKEQQLPSDVWIFTFPKEQCEEILNGIKLLNLDDCQLEALSAEAVKNAVFC